ncbi:hypothetical protein FACS1894120_2220 [Clostridia bacterium]|nr:hypothetical protein FACS1894120_2220 [Clostridia bacterium]
MKTKITDKSLCYTGESVILAGAARRISENSEINGTELSQSLLRTGGAAVVEGYTDALRKAGVSYFESSDMRVTALAIGRRVKGMLHRVGDPEDIFFINLVRDKLIKEEGGADVLPYAVLPLHMAFLANRIQIPVILELPVKPGEDVWEVIKVVAENICLDKYAAVRLCGAIPDDGEEVREIVRKYRASYAPPIDFCPSTDDMSMLQSAVSAYRAECDLLTMRFGNVGSGDVPNLVSLEEFLITMATAYHTIVSREYTGGLAIAEDMAQLCGISANQNIAAFINHYKLPFRFIPSVDVAPVHIRHLYTPAPDVKKQYALYSMDKKPGGRFTLAADEDLEDEISKLVDSAIFQVIADK